MTEQEQRIQAQRELLHNAKSRGKLAQLKAFCKLSGPGWMQSATTLGGGSLASALYLGVLGGFGFMWLQPIAMILGIIMLAAISYVTLSIGDKPMREINKNISPILGYGWAIGSLFACMVFAMPQFSLAVASIEQNIAPSCFTDMGNSMTDEIVITAIFFLIAMIMIAIYAGGGKGVKIFEWFIKGSVAAIVICFFGVVIQLSVSGAIDWGRVMAGFVPDFSILSQPSADFMQYINKLGAEGKEFWSTMIVAQQRDVVISAAAMAVGINMTFLFHYSMLKKGWDKDFRSLSIFDLSTGLFIPFLLATSCIVVASASQFHAKPANGLANAEIIITGKVEANMAQVSKLDNEKFLCLVEPIDVKLPAQNLIKPYVKLLDERLAKTLGKDKFNSLKQEERVAEYNKISQDEKMMAAMLVKRDASNLSETLAPLVGDDVARYIFGFGVMGMAMNAILMNMLICGTCFSEIFGKFEKAKWQIFGSFIIIISAITSLFWEGAKMWLVIHAGVVAMVLLPIAYGAFLVIMNSKKIMGDAAPRGLARLIWNVLMTTSVLAASGASLWVLWNKIGIYGPIAFFAFLALVVISYFSIKAKKNA